MKKDIYRLIQLYKIIHFYDYSKSITISIYFIIKYEIVELYQSIIIKTNKCLLKKKKLVIYFLFIYLFIPKICLKNISKKKEV